MNYKTIELRFEKSIAKLTLNRPEALNALNLEMGRELIDAFGRITDEGAHCVLLTGQGRAFCAGGDVKAMASGDRVDEFFADALEMIHRAIATLAAYPRVVIAAINGFASGAGMNLALACDLRIAGESARFNEAFVRIGAVPDCGGTYHLPRIVGWSRAAELMLLGDMVDAHEAERLGIVTRVVADTELIAVASELAVRVAAGPMAAHERIKHLLQASATSTLNEQLEREAQMQREIGQTEDFLEGVTAFMEKRPPNYSGR
jgi:2-(1,2-epoxy-1,2-dihydrophenyl)acetyl-CoA isomerase